MAMHTLCGDQPGRERAEVCDRQGVQLPRPQPQVPVAGGWKVREAISDIQKVAETSRRRRPDKVAGRGGLHQQNGRGAEQGHREVRLQRMGRHIKMHDDALQGAEGGAPYAAKGSAVQARRQRSFVTQHSGGIKRD